MACLWLVGGSACAEQAVSPCRPGVCPPGTRCDAADGRCVPSDSALPGTGPLGGAVRVLAGDPLGVAVHEPEAGAVWFEQRQPGAVEGPVVDRVRVDGGTASSGVMGRWLAAARDRDGRPHLAYYDAGARVLKAASRTDGAWRVDVVDGDGDADVGRWVSLTVDDAFGRHLAYRAESDRSLRLLSLAARGCRPQGLADDEFAPVRVTAQDMDDAQMPSDDFGEYTSIAVGGDHRLLVTFYDRGRGNLVLARCDGSRPSLQILDGEDEQGRDTGDVGAWSSLAVSRTGEVGVAYFDRTRGQLKYVESASGELRTVLVDDGSLCEGADASVVGQGAALAMLPSDASGAARARIAYVDASVRAVRVARRSPHGAWFCETVASLTDFATSGPVTGPGDEDEGAPLEDRAAESSGFVGLGLGLDLAVGDDDGLVVGYGWWSVTDGRTDRGVTVRTVPAKVP